MHTNITGGLVEKILTPLNSHARNGTSNGARGDTAHRALFYTVKVLERKMLTNKFRIRPTSYKRTGSAAAMNFR